MISRDNFPNSLLRAKSMCAFLYFLFCHSLCPFHLSCVLDKLKVVFGGRHCQTNADRPLTKQGFLVTVAAILDSRNFHISGERDEWNKFTVHMNSKATWFLHTVAWNIIIFIIYLSLSETTGPNIGIKKLKLICEIYPFPPSLLQLPLHWSLFWPDRSVTKSLLGSKRERNVLCSFHQMISVFSDWKAHSPKRRARKLTCSGLREVFQKPFWNLDRKE